MGRAPVRLLAGVALVTVCTVSARSLVEDYGNRAPKRYGLVAMRCAGTAPAVCMPEATVQDVEAVRAEVTAAVEDLAGTGIAAPPRLVTDSTADTWRTGLARAEVMGDAIDVPCRSTRAGDTRPAVLGLSTRMGLPDPYANGSEPRFDRIRTLGEVRARVADALALPPDDQLAWYHAQLVEACRTGDR